MTARISDEAQAQLLAFEALVEGWADRLDLVSTLDLERFHERHVLDSLRALPLVDSLPPGPGVDVGSGAGLPGIPLAICRPERTWRLLEPRRRRAAFLEEVVRALDLSCEVVTLTAEQAATEPGLAATHVIGLARAVAPPPTALAMVRPLVRPDGVAGVFVAPAQPIPPEATVWRGALAIVRADGNPPSP